MKMKYQVFIILITTVCFLCETQGDLKVSGVRCGSKICKTQEYCSAFDNRCYPCSDICNEGHHNYDASLCSRDCQDYLHDLRYVRKDGSDDGNDDLRVVVQRLQFMVTVTLTLTCIVLVILITIIVLQIYRWKKNNNITLSNLCDKLCLKKTNSNSNKTSGNGVTAGEIREKPELRLDMPTPGTQSEHSPATLTTTISRRPAEDSALDYAYDNHAMSGSPSPNSKPRESNF